MLQIIMNPGTTPAVLGKGVDTAPGGDDERVKELLAATRAAQPVLTNQQKNSETNPVSDKRTAHDKVCQTLAEVVTLTEAHGRNAAKEHLRPTDDGHDLADNPVSQHKDPADSTLSGLLEVQLEIEAQHDLRDQQEHQPVRERGVGILAELAALVGVAEEVGQDGDDGSDDLEGDVPARADDL